MPSQYRDWNWSYYEGIVWMRKSIEIPQSMIGKDLEIELGLAEMNYSLYFNGEEICKTVWNAAPSHRYTIPASIITNRQNVISVRFSILWGGGGFNTTADHMYLTDGKEKISIAGSWRYQKDLEPRVPKLHNFHKYPTYLYNAMIHPVIPYGLKGFIWYQGEENTNRADEYHELFSLMINDWRIRWQQGYLPFLYVQLANYLPRQQEPSESNWAELREAQAMTLTEPHTGMACIIDLGEGGNIHPKNKQDVGLRLSLLAEKMVYGKEVQAFSPLYDHHTKEGNTIRIFFNETGALLSIGEGTKVEGFAIAGADGKYRWADARIDGNTVIVSSPEVSDPIHVRYAWSDNPACNLINSAGLPAIPFRTDAP